MFCLRVSVPIVNSSRKHQPDQSRKHQPDQQASTRAAKPTPPDQGRQANAAGPGPPNQRHRTRAAKPAPPDQSAQASANQRQVASHDHQQHHCDWPTPEGNTSQLLKHYCDWPTPECDTSQFLNQSLCLATNRKHHQRV